MSQPLRRVGVSRTKDPQQIRRADKRFDAFGNPVLTRSELQEQIIALESLVKDNAAQIQEITAALKEAGTN